jgi:hypothetical protein
MAHSSSSSSSSRRRRGRRRRRRRRRRSRWSPYRATAGCSSNCCTTVG